MAIIDPVNTGDFIDDPDSDDAYSAFVKVNANEKALNEEVRSIERGGTGADTAAKALANILPAGTPGQVIRYAATAWVAEDIPTFTTGVPGLVPARVGAVATKYLREDGTWVTPTNTTYTNMSAAEIAAGTATTGRLITPKDLKTAIDTHSLSNGTSKVPIANGGTGASTAAGARTNLGLASFVVDVEQAGVTSPNTGVGIYAKDNGEVFLWPGASATMPRWSITDGGTGARNAVDARVNLDVSYAGGLTGIYGTDNLPYTAKTGVYGDNQPGWVNAGIAHFNSNGSSASSLQFWYGYSNQLMFRTSRDNYGFETPWSVIRSERNTIVDGNGFIKQASPVIELYTSKIELNDQAKQQPITFEKLGVGDYLIKGSLGFAQTNWYVEQPKDANGNAYHAVIYDTLENGDISIKTYERKLDGVNIVADLTKPIDIKENRFIAIRLHEEPEVPTQPQVDPEILDNEGNPAPSLHHVLEDGVWTITAEYAAILEQKRLEDMQPLKRRQFRLALVMNGFDLAAVEALIDQIENPMQRTIVKIEWQDATDFERTNPSLLLMAELMGLTSAQVDELWSFGLSL